MANRLNDDKRSEIVCLVAQRYNSGESLDAGRVVADYKIAPAEANRILYDVKVRGAGRTQQGKEETKKA